MTRTNETNEHKDDVCSFAESANKQIIIEHAVEQVERKLLFTTSNIDCEKLEPVIEFRDLNHAVCLSKEWQDRLGLSEWVIKISLCDPHELENTDCLGECDYRAVLKCAKIKILKLKYGGKGVLKLCAEQTLVHELLHCKFALIDIETDDDILALATHQIMEELATALICAKYDIQREWFNNIKY